MCSILFILLKVLMFYRDLQHHNSYKKVPVSPF
jgi:hypothetical protein